MLLVNPFHSFREWCIWGFAVSVLSASCQLTYAQAVQLTGVVLETSRLKIEGFSIKESSVRFIEHSKIWGEDNNDGANERERGCNYLLIELGLENSYNTPKTEELDLTITLPRGFVYPLNLKLYPLNDYTNLRVVYPLHPVMGLERHIGKHFVRPKPIVIGKNDKIRLEISNKAGRTEGQSPLVP